MAAECKNNGYVMAIAEWGPIVWKSVMLNQVDKLHMEHHGTYPRMDMTVLHILILLKTISILKK